MTNEDPRWTFVEEQDIVTKWVARDSFGATVFNGDIHITGGRTRPYTGWDYVNQDDVCDHWWSGSGKRPDNGQETPGTGLRCDTDSDCRGYSGSVCDAAHKTYPPSPRARASSCT